MEINTGITRKINLYSDTYKKENKYLLISKLKQGILKQYENDDLSRISSYINNKIHGICITYNTNMEDMKNFEKYICKISYYNNGKLEGLYKEYYDNGKLYCIYNNKNGYKNGKYISYHINGIIFEELYYDSGKKNGKYKKYYNNGNVFIECNMLNDNIHGEYTRYNEDGVITHKYNFIDNKIIDEEFDITIQNYSLL